MLGTALGLFLFLKSGRTVDLDRGLGLPVDDLKKSDNSAPVLIENGDIPNQNRLSSPPEGIKAVYLTKNSAGLEDKVGSIIELIRETELNAVVIDIKDYSGYVSYDIKNAEVEKYGAKNPAKEIPIKHLNELIKRFHDEGIYLIGRITVFQDPILAKARPDLAVQDKSKDGPWLDRKKLAWMDPSAKEVWDYNAAVAKDILDRGFDEVNFDYIRFPSDGDLDNMAFPFWDGTIDKHIVLKRFFEYLRTSLPDAKLSVDLFGMAAFADNDLGIGQIIEDAYEFFDYVCPMVYPSHYEKGFLGYKNPADHPYEVIKYSMEIALKKLNDANVKIAEENRLDPAANKKLFAAKLRPWLQDFDLGADYDAQKVRSEIEAVYDSGLDSGWFLWDPRNVYTREALKPEE